MTDGSVGFNEATLEMNGPLQVGNDGDPVISDGGVKAGEITIGHLPPLDFLAPPVERLAVANGGSVLITSGLLRVGVAGDGQLDISRGAGATSAETWLGDGAPSSATVRDANTLWTTGNVAVGHTVTGTLLIENGALVASDTVLVGLGENRPAPQLTSRATVRGNGSQWRVQRLRIGLDQGGTVAIEDGASLIATALDLGVSVLTDASNAQLVVQSSPGTRRATATVSDDAFVGAFPGSLAALDVRAGGLVSLGADLAAGMQPDALGLIRIGGRETGGNPATLWALAPGLQPGRRRRQVHAFRVASE